VLDPRTATDDTLEALDLVAAEARSYLESLPDAPVRSETATDTALGFGGPLPEEGDGAVAALTELLRDGLDAHVRSGGPRFFHWVIGGSTPAALAADWVASLLDQNAGGWDASPLASRLEAVSLGWLRDLFGLPADWGGVLTTGATMANFAGLAAARQWWGEQHGVDVAEEGLTGRIPVLTSGFVHVTAVKALSMLGIGRHSLRRFELDPTGRLDADRLEGALRELRGAPAIVIGNAGEVNAGHFDPLEQLADLADRYGAWLHVDGAFGLFARASPRVAGLVAGVERADSVVSDGHKWLNVPYDCGFAFVRDPRYLTASFAAGADYLPEARDEQPIFGFLGPELSRRARSLSVWATLKAYGRSGVREVVERCLDHAAHVAGLVEAADDLELLAPAPLNVVCFRYRPPDVPEDQLDELNRRIGEAVLTDGRVYVGTTVWADKVAFRPAFVNWRTTRPDAELLVETVRDLGARLAVRA
jgi:glutamate/tyrosine decarboxylase-like PLP-dependent enzyme